MPTWLHLLVMQSLLGLVFCAYLLTWLAVICLAAFLPPYLAGQALSGEALVFAAWLAYVLGVPATVFAGVWWLVDGPRAARDWFRASVAALCPACGKRAAYAVGSRPVRYDCSACGHLHETTFVERGVHAETDERGLPPKWHHLLRREQSRENDD
jgi:hypothetical protein